MGEVYNHQEGYCLVLSGGGAKGVYHIGVWKALKELNIKVNAFIGNSVGAIVAAFLAQDLGNLLEEIGPELGLDFVVKVPGEFIEKGELTIPRCKFSAYRRFYRSVVKGKSGLDTSPLRGLLKKYLDEEKIRSSPNDLGVVTVNISNLRSRYVFLEDMEEGSLIDYLMASSAVPGFERPVIGGKKYMDGAVFDNIPYTMARERGYRKIIVVDISGVGINRRPNIQGTDTVYIKNSINMGGIFDFNKEFLKRYLHLGYLDTMKTLGRLRGEQYFIRPDTRWEERLDGRLANENEVSAKTIREALPKRMSLEKDLLYPLLDCAASSFRIERVKEYKVDELLAEVTGKKKNEDERIEDLKTRFEEQKAIKYPRILKEILKEARDSESSKETPYFYFRLVEDVVGKKLPKFLKKTYLRVYARVNSGNLALKLLGDGREQ